MINIFVKTFREKNTLKQVESNQPNRNSTTRKEEKWGTTIVCKLALLSFSTKTPSKNSQYIKMYFSRRPSYKL